MKLQRTKKRLVVSNNVEDLDILLNYGFKKSAVGNYEYGRGEGEYWFGIIVFGKPNIIFDITKRDVYMLCNFDYTQFGSRDIYVDELLDIGVIFELIRDGIVELEITEE